MSRAPGRRAATRTAIVATVLFGVVLALVSWAPAEARNVHVRRAYFGAHDGTIDGSGNYLSTSRLHEGSVRLWSVGVRWEDIERQRGKYSWARLDQLVSAAQKAHADVTMVVAMTPRFYAARDTDPPSSLKPYKRFVHALMKRYRNFHGSRGIAAYQVWNEANIKTYWTGSNARLAQLTKALHDVGKNVDPRAKVIGPPMVTRLKYQMTALERFYNTRVNGLKVWHYVDAVAFSLYPLSNYGRRLGVPEDSMKLLNQARRGLRRDGVPASKPIWNTEINYGLLTGGSGHAVKISAARQASNVMRTYLLNAANGVARVYWYRYDWARIGNLPNTFLSNPDDFSSLTPAGHAYRRIQAWMHGTLIGPSRHARPCQHNARGTYTCVVRDSHGTRRIYWNPFRTGTVRLPKGVHHKVGVLGGVTSVRPRSTIKVGYAPVLVRR